jgi:type IV pilus assembly protein PilE
MKPLLSRHASRSAGFTLIELMVTITIGTILLSIAIPSYTSSVRKSRRTEARTALLDLAAREERFFSTNSAYTTTAANLGYGGAFPAPVGSSYYQVNVALTATGGFQASAQPINAQTTDTCGTFQLDNTGLQTVTGATAAATCWSN